MSPTLTKEKEMPDFRVRAYRRQLVEVIVNAKDDEWAWEHAIDTDKHEWDVVETYEIEDFVSATPIEDECDDPRYWLEG